MREACFTIRKINPCGRFAARPPAAFFLFRKPFRRMGRSRNISGGLHFQGKFVTLIIISHKKRIMINNPDGILPEQAPEFKEFDKILPEK
ncbi:hypothetical protein B4135_2050 [Caldibacillus debilis]|uniref:Uncharacterized protein n=1 Tax=Caldibacillus debilis TaxID=301148 RepID=A0A150M5E1_9BACI|nr:hypothetical protein B4135_2050 [Caldibacillus debilis]